MDVLAVVAIIIFLVWFFAIRGSKQDEGLDNGIGATYFANNPAPDENEMEFSRAENARDEALRKWDAKREERELSRSETVAKLHKADEIVRELELQHALQRILRGLEFFETPADAQPLWSLPEMMSNHRFEGRKYEHCTHHWNWDGAAYSLEKENSGYDAEDSVHSINLRLSYKSEVVLDLCYNGDYSSLTETLTYRSVNALKVGAWMADVVTMGIELDEAVDAILDDAVDEMDREIADKIDLGKTN